MCGDCNWKQEIEDKVSGPDCGKCGEHFLDCHCDAQAKKILRFLQEMRRKLEKFNSDEDERYLSAFNDGWFCGATHVLNGLESILELEKTDPL